MLIMHSLSPLGGPGFTFHFSSAADIFRNFFGTDDPFNFGHFDSFSDPFSDPFGE